MTSVLEVRRYRTKPDVRKPLVDLLRARAFLLQRELGSKPLGPVPSREPLEATFHQGVSGVNGLDVEAVPVLDDVSAVVERDTGDRRSARPAVDAGGG